MLILCGNTTVSQNWEIDEKEAMGYSRIYYVHSGSVTYIGGGESMRLKPGRVYIMPNSIPYQVRRDSSEDFVCTYLHVEIPMVWVNGIIELTPGTDDSLYHFMNLARRLIDEGQKKLLSQFVENIVYFFRDHENCVYYSEFLHKITTYIQEHISEKITVEELSGLYHYNANYFIEVFKKEANCTPYQYIVRAKMQKALQLLERGKDMTFVTEALGYADISSFCRVFSRYYGMSPRGYRKTQKAIP